MLKKKPFAVEIIPSVKVAQAPIYSYLYFIYTCKRFRDTICMALMLIAAVAALPRPLTPEQITSNFGRHTLYNAKLKEFLETNLNRKFFNWPAFFWDFVYADSGRSVLSSEIGCGQG
jgi:hypothetical protein